MAKGGKATNLNNDNNIYNVVSTYYVLGASQMIHLSNLCQQPYENVIYLNFMYEKNEACKLNLSRDQER